MCFFSQRSKGLVFFQYDIQGKMTFQKIVQDSFIKYNLALVFVFLKHCFYSQKTQPVINQHGNSIPIRTPTGDRIKPWTDYIMTCLSEEDSVQRRVTDSLQQSGGWIQEECTAFTTSLYSIGLITLTGVNINFKYL